MSVLLAPIGNGFQFFDANGRPLNGGFLYTYLAGSTTPASTYTTNTGTISNTNPIVLGSDGRPPQEIWLTSGTSYKFVLTDNSYVTIGTYDNLYGIVNAAPVANPVPSGAIIMWSGSIGSIPAGYYICDGNNGTPDLRDRFVVGAGNTYAVGNTGGFTSSVTSSIGTNLPLYYSLAFIQKS